MTTTDDISGGARTSIAVRPSLADDGVLSSLLAYAAGDFLHAFAASDEAPAEEIGQIIFGVAGVLRGESEIVDLPEGWDIGAVGARLRPGLAAAIEAMPEEDKAIFAADEEVVVLAIHLFFETLYEAAHSRGVFVGEAGEDAVNAFLGDPDTLAEFDFWADWLLGKTKKGPFDDNE